MVPYLVVPVTLALKALLAAGVVALVMAVFCFHRLKEWMRRHEALLDEDPRRMAVSLHERLKSGKYRTCYGIFDPVRERFVEAEIVESDEVDVETQRQHRRNPVNVYARN